MPNKSREQRNLVILHLTHAEIDVLVLSVLSYHMDVQRSLETEKELDENTIYIDYLENTSELLYNLYGVLKTHLL